jgi:hypothetical protein
MQTPNFPEDTQEENAYQIQDSKRPVYNYKPDASQEFELKN